MEKTPRGFLNAGASAVMEEAAHLANELRLILATNRILMQERKEILRSQSRMAMQCAKRLRAIEMDVRDCVADRTVVKSAANEAPKS
jgi:hypothetical protein